MKKDLVLVAHRTEHNCNVCKILRQSHIEVSHTDNIQNIKEGLSMYSPSFLLLDFNITGVKTLLKELACGSLQLPQYIIVADSYSDGAKRAAMLRLGADACVEIPINAEEVLAIIEAVQRYESRKSQLTSSNHRLQIKYKELIIDTSQRSVTIHGTLVALTRKEYDVLCVLANHIGFVMTKEEIYTAVWKAKYDPKTTNVSDQISSLRRKLRLSSKDTSYIQTVIGVGYRFGTLA